MMALALAGSAFVAGPVPAEEVATRGVAITSLVYAGSGCPPRSGVTAVLVDLNNDRLPDRLRLNFPSSYNARQGPGIPIAERRRNCNLLVSLSVPAGKQFAIRAAIYRGVAGLPRGVLGLQQSVYQYPFATGDASLQTLIQGPFVGAYWRQETLDPKEWIWSPCRLSTPLNLRTQIFLSSLQRPGATLSVTRHVYELAWRSCSR
jgi:hypothetical protein